MRPRPQRFRIPLSWLDPGRELLAIKVSADSAGKVGMVWDYLEKRGLALLGAALNVGREGAVAFGVVDATGLGLEAAREAALGIPIEGVSVEVIDAGRGFASTGGHELEVGSGRAVMASERTLLGLFRGIRELMGDDAGAAFLYYAGAMSGREWGRLLRDMGYDAGAALRVNFRSLESQGYATRVEVLEGKDRFRIEVYDLVECDLLSSYAARKGGMRTSHWFRGAVAGFLSAALGGEWEVEEVECVNEGSDKCAFEARRRPG